MDLPGWATAALVTLLGVVLTVTAWLARQHVDQLRDRIASLETRLSNLETHVSEIKASLAEIHGLLAHRPRRLTPAP